MRLHSITGSVVNIPEPSASQAPVLHQCSFTTSMSLSLAPLIRAGSFVTGTTVSTRVLFGCVSYRSCLRLQHTSCHDTYLNRECPKLTVTAAIIPPQSNSFAHIRHYTSVRYTLTTPGGVCSQQWSYDVHSLAQFS